MAVGSGVAATATVPIEAGISQVPQQSVPAKRAKFSLVARLRHSSSDRIEFDGIEYTADRNYCKLISIKTVIRAKTRLGRQRRQLASLITIGPVKQTSFNEITIAMQRRHLLRHLALGTTGAIAATACQSGTGSSESAANAPSRPRIKWRMVTSWPPSLDTIHGGAKLLAERVAAMTEDRFTISVYAAGEIVPALNVLDAVQAGTVECGHTSSYYYIGKNPALAFGTSVPFGLNAQQQNAWFYHGGGLETMHRLYADFNILSFPTGNTGVQMGGWFKRDIQSLADLQGLKMRIPGLGGTVMAELGVSVQVLPAGEVFLALERNTIDAAEFVGPYDDEKLGLHKAAPLYYYPGWWEPGPTLETLVSRSAWDKLPSEYQEVFTTAAKEVNQDMLARYDALNLAALQRLREGGTQLRPYSPEILQAAQRISDDLLATRAAEDGTFREVYDSWQQFRDRITQWHEVAEFSYARLASQ